MDKKTLFLCLSAIGSATGNTYTKAEIDEMIAELKQFETAKVDHLPLRGEPNVLYFVPRTTASGNDACYEYMWMNDKWEFVGSTEVDLTDYWTIDEVKQYVDDNAYVLPQATEDTLGGVKLSSNGAVSVDNDGNMIVATVEDSDIEALFSH